MFNIVSLTAMRQIWSLALACLTKLKILTKHERILISYKFFHINVVLTIISNQGQDQKKLDYINTLGKERTICVGNGPNDRLMLKGACIGIAVLGDEGLASSSFMAADIVVKDIHQTGLF